MHRAVKSGFYQTAEILIDHGADLEASDPKGETPLFEAARTTIKDFAKLKKTIELMIKKGANQGALNSKGKTAHEIAKQSKRPDKSKVAKLLG